jgi:glycosyltransferase involved in cell wall biosynthesis
VTGFHQVLAAAAHGDAITDSAFEIRDLLRRVGPSDIYARHIAPEMRDEVRRLEDFPPRGGADVLLYHASIGEPLVHAFLLSRREPLVLVYHNVTPARYFEPWDATFAELLELGRSELYELRHRVSVALADSTFNAVELQALGYRDVRVVPPVIDPLRLARVTPTPSVVHHLDTRIAQPFFLYVGQLLPHKRPDFLVEAMHVATTYLGLGATLMLVGHPRLPKYAQAIHELVRELNLPNVHVVGSVSTPDLAAFYSRATGLVTASEHEGFCVPLVEAMAFGLPIVARACGAIPETLADGGLLLSPGERPPVLAEALESLVLDGALRGRLAGAAGRRLEAFERTRAQRELLSVLAEAV